MVLRKFHSREAEEALKLAPTSQEASNRAWLVTFTDLVSLMLTFFVLLFSMSNVQVSQWENIVDSLSRTLQPTPEKTIKAVSATFNIGTIFRKRAINLDYLSAVVEDSVAKEQLLPGTRIVRLEDRLVIALPGAGLFATQGVELTEAGRQSIFVLGGMLRNFGNQIGINGHTAQGADPADGFNTNWEYSTTRSAAVANALRATGYPEKITAFGYSDSRAGDLEGLDTAARDRLANRIDIVIMPTTGPSE